MSRRLALLFGATLLFTGCAGAGLLSAAVGLVGLLATLGISACAEPDEDCSCVTAGETCPGASDASGPSAETTP